MEEVVEIVVGLLIAPDFIPYIFNVENKLFVSIVYIMFILLKCSYMVAHIFVCYGVKMEIKGVIQILVVLEKVALHVAPRGHRYQLYL